MDGENEVIEFKVAPVGWRAVYEDQDAGRIRHKPIPGWYVCRNQEGDTFAYPCVHPEDPRVNLMAADEAAGWGTLVAIRGPGEPDWSPAEGA